MNKLFSISLLLFFLLLGCKSLELDNDQRAEVSVSYKNEEENHETGDDISHNDLSSNDKVENKKTNDRTVTEQVPVDLIEVVDGDSIKVRINGEVESVRYLLIDTPETNHPNMCVQPYGKEASNRNEELLRSGSVTLEFDGPERDKYDRLLAHVYVDGISVQQTLLEEGLARVAYIYNPPYKHLDAYYQAEELAKEKRLNIWNKDDYVSENGFSDCVGDIDELQVSEEDFSTNKEDFKNCTELRKVYPDGVPKGHPAYQEKMDRDDDGHACE